MYRPDSLSLEEKPMLLLDNPASISELHNEDDISPRNNPEKRKN